MPTTNTTRKKQNYLNPKVPQSQEFQGIEPHY